jgi:Tfp pilus assembly protein PilO
MSSIFEDLNDLVTNNPAGRVLAITLLILIFAGAVALGFAWWITHMH